MWSILIDQLIILTTLTLVTGTVTQPLPSVTYTTDEFDGNISELELNTLFKGTWSWSFKGHERVHTHFTVCIILSKCTEVY